MADFFLVVSAAFLGKLLENLIIFAKSKVYMTPFKERKKIAFDILKRWRG